MDKIIIAKQELITTLFDMNRLPPYYTVRINIRSVDTIS